MSDQATLESTHTRPGGSPLDMAGRLAGAVRFQTISHQDPAQDDAAAFRGLHAYLATAFPRVHATMAREVIGRSSLLYTWPGRDPAPAPILLTGHQDVVPIEPGTENDWLFPPFAGSIEQGFIWGRGTMDDKAALLGLLEAVESLLAAGFVPARTILLAFGDDEEVGGVNGAAQLVAHLRARGIRPEYVLDEGLSVTEGIVANVRRPVAMIGVAEKGYLSLELSVQVPGGHSSMPPRDTSIGILSAAIARLAQHPMPARLVEPAAQLVACLAADMSPAARLLLSSRRLSGPIVTRLLDRSPSTAALLRTTIAPTIFEAGVKENVLCGQARAVVNLRILPGDSIAGATEHVRRAIADPRVRIAPTGVMRGEPSSVADTDAPAFRAVEQAIRAVFGGPDGQGVLIAPGLVLGGTDCKHYAALGGPCYRFSPLWVRPDDLARVHGTNERIAVDHYARVVEFYMRLIQAPGGSEPRPH